MAAVQFVELALVRLVVELVAGLTGGTARLLSPDDYYRHIMIIMVVMTIIMVMRTIIMVTIMIIMMMAMIIMVVNCDNSSSIIASYQL